MNSETAAAIADAFREHREAFGVSVTVAGVTVEAVVAETPFGRDLVEGGFADEGEVNLKALASDFETLPAIGNAAVYRERNFRVAHLAAQPGSDIIELRLRPVRGK